MNVWESVFLQSRVNNGTYDEDGLPQLHWDWPKGTWLQSRLYFLRERRNVLSLKPSPNVTDSDERGAM